MSAIDVDQQSAARAVWISGAYGYNGELLYFRDIFAEFARRFPSGVVPVSRDFPTGRYPGIPLAPIFGFHRFGRSRRLVGGVEYTGVFSACRLLPRGGGCFDYRPMYLSWLNSVPRRLWDSSWRSCLGAGLCC